MSSLEKGEDVVKSAMNSRGGKRHFLGKKNLTCDVNISRGGVQGRRCPGSTAVAGSDAFGSRGRLFYFSIHQAKVIYTMSYILYLAQAHGNGP